jgi:hypothetical protein
MKRRWGLAGLVLAVLSLAPERALAQATCASADLTFLPPDGRVLTFTAAASTTYMFVAGTNLATGGVLRSYSVEVNGLNGGYNAAPNLYVRNDAVCALANVGPTLRDTTRIEPRVACEVGTCLDSNGRYSFSTSDPFTNFVVENDHAFLVPYTISVAETTMFSPAWSTNGGYATYYSFFNNTSQPVTAVLTLRTTAGGLGGTATLTILPFNTLATNTVALGTSPNLTGTARLTHDGPPGALTVEADIANFTTSPAYIQPVRFEAPRQVR